jgi:DNA invertase Pin-like site-specific DNA recombinase
VTTSELVTSNHLTRKAIIYVRQSTPNQVLSNQESLRLQYALEQRALELGWSKAGLDLIDIDLGQSAASAEHRKGFKKMIAQVALGNVGIILSSEVTRISRNCSDWFPLLDICALRDCLIADRDGVYDPASSNGRLLLGLKGQLSELELRMIHARMTGGLLNKAKRGELALVLPTGLVRDDQRRVVKDPNLEVQARIQLIFDSFLRLKTASKVLRFLNEQALSVPRRDRFGDIVWKKPSMSAIVEMLKNPAYAGAFAYGRTRTIRHESGQIRQRRLPMDQWRFLVHDKYPAYIDWATYESIQTMLKDNHANYKLQSRGVPRQGAALLVGIVYCGECGHKMLVQYKRGLRYICDYRRRHFQGSVCQHIPGMPIERQVVKAFLDALSPVELNAYERAVTAQEKADAELDQAHTQQLRRLRYEADLAQRQYNRVDPDNRLVAAELERRWETALQALEHAEQEHAEQRRERSSRLAALPAELKAAFEALGQQLPVIWEQNLLQLQHKKAFLRCLVDKVVIYRVTRDCIETRIVWQGGATTTLHIPIPVGSFAELSQADEMEEKIVELSRKGKSDEQIAAELAQQGYRSPTRPDTVLPSTVRGIRLKHGILREHKGSDPRHVPGYLTLPQVAQLLGVTQNAIHYYIRNGRILIAKNPSTGLYLFPDKPDTLDLIRKLRTGQLHHVDFSRGCQDA